jgi:ABC-type branched-subunit amino acid transport system ATPase component/ABC-type branched-subunit amino acid transport system permease subunit
MINYIAQIAVFVAIFLLLATSLNLVLGFGGVFSIMQAVFYGVGAYTAADLIVFVHAPFPLDLLGALVVAMALGALVAGLLMRIAGELVIIATLALQLVFSTIFRNWTAVTGGSYGIFGIGRPAVFGYPLTSLPAFACMAALVAAAAFAAALLIARSPFGLAVRAQREDAVLAGALGHDVVRERATVFVIGAGLAGLAGALYAQFVGYVDPSGFDVNQSLSIITIVVVGGLGNLWGTLGAAIILTFLPQLLILLPATSSAAAQFQLLLYGVILVLVVRFWPSGILPEQPSVRLMPRRGTRSADVVQAGSAPELVDRIAGITVAGMQTAAPVVRLDGVSKSFGGLRAVDDVSFAIEPGRVTALIGPNGAGKTTLFNLICGLLRPDGGHVFFGTQETTHSQPFEIARLGVTRTFQDVRIFPRLTALENVVFALSKMSGGATPLTERAGAVLVNVGLQAHADRLAGSLSYAEQKILMMGLVLSREDPVVFLDEIAAGLDQGSVRALAGLVRRIAASGRAVCVVEHNLSFVWDVADIVYVLDAGRVIAGGVPADIQADAKVVEIYFGQSGAHGHA